VTPLFDHERPLLLVLREGEHAADGIEAVLVHPEVASYDMPPLWALERAGVDLVESLPRVATIERSNLRQVLDALLALCDEAALDRLARNSWVSVDERVRAFYLERGALRTFASIFKMAPPTVEEAPPRSFVEDRIHEHAFVVEYRLLREAGERDLRAPSEEGSLVLYPFDPANGEARREADLEPGVGVILEAFAYAGARERHRKMLEEVAHQRGWRVIDAGA
jgi:hypothetical protein